MCCRGAPAHGLCGHMRLGRALLAERRLWALCAQGAHDHGPRGLGSRRQGNLHYYRTVCLRH